MTQQEIAALAMSGATTIVAAMATDAWATVRDGILAVVRRRSPELHAGIEAQLDDGAALVVPSQGAEAARRLLIRQWQLELERFLAVYPDAAEELAAQTDRMRAALAAAPQQHNQHNNAHGHGTVNAVQDGNQYNFSMDSGHRLPVPPAGPARQERED
ncbi:hypothetical protein J7E93_08165 [Streptomyces sp. ISL-36]|uniref:hypothetical protein n=1 Tax=Streptomyces sp. ISL-36 TaxID=2819182 RepID=UPI001BEB5AB6|nr:hypothetical protein [Streptomyces sp. ISL-36]MBT2440093.1 hypothetical protein [Streptomyces sp. ISL-36]